MKKKYLIIGGLSLVILALGIWLGQQIQDLNEEINQLNTQVDKYAGLEDQLASLEEDKSHFEERVNQLTSDKTGLEEDLKRAREETAHLEDQVAALEETGPDLLTSFEAYTDRVTTYKDGILYTKLSPIRYETYLTLSVVGYGDTQSDQPEIIDLSVDRPATIAIEIIGSIYDVRIEKIRWDDDFKDYQVIDEVVYYEKLTNSNLLFDSVLAETLPSELLSWSDDQGNRKYYLIHDFGMGDITSLVIFSQEASLEAWWENQE